LLEGWRDQIGSANAARRNASVAVAPLVVILRARTRGFIAVLRDGAVNSLLASGADGASTDTAQLLEVIECVKAATFPCDSADSPLHARELAFALGSIARWWDTHRAAAALDVGAMRAARTRRRIVERIATALASVPRHRRAELSGAIAAAQEVVRLPLSASAEQALAALATAPIADEQWLLGLATFSELHRRAGHEESRPGHVSLNPDVAALVLLVPGADAPDV
jgi:hypothetical protein